VDLTEIVADMAATMAPLAVARDCSIAFTDSAQPIRITGNGSAIGDAVRNILENAISHSPRGSEISISVHSDGCVEIATTAPVFRPTNVRRSLTVFGVGRLQSATGRVWALPLFARSCGSSRDRWCAGQSQRRRSLYSEVSFVRGAKPGSAPLTRDSGTVTRRTAERSDQARRYPWSGEPAA